jgi:diaminohydroxyphosphoribosylaminopyrimidine deaminase/5-amino-6-(5-phosphoribosylamino)uracil reductase
VDALIAAGVKRVVVAMQDPNPMVAGQGILRLQAHGIAVICGLMQNEALTLNPGFVKRMTLALPYVRSKIAASLDGRTALNNGESQWITGEQARLDVQHWRAQSCAIVTGIGTVLADNPSMNVRLQPSKRQPLRVIVDSCLRTPVNCKMFDTVQHNPVLIAYATDPNQQVAFLSAAGAECLHVPNVSGQVDLKALLLELALRGMNEVLVEAGQGLNGALLTTGLIDEFVFYYAPKLMGADARAMFAFSELTDMQQVKHLKILDVRQIGSDIRLRAQPLTN